MTDRLSSYSSNGLDFPSQPKVQRNGKPRSVTFNSDCDVAIIHTSAEAYSLEDIMRFKQMMVLDVRRVRQYLASMPDSEINHDHLYDCVGIERYVSQAVRRRTMAATRAHSQTVLEEQTFQEQGNICDEEHLALVSKRSSRWGRDRAEQLAAGYLQLEE
mmetsp:Transcript_10569/g.23406  ORF Transcript_10569/g.23406 Transcript_10569/m.23406 type:complete len:159 (+) Transcript_10569:84-560(+)|eukprot:CAMPEP_0172304620 /NCGR_PEP_ID=MMETSP1058-20130122/6012_1 /TAXON_ID=83371 /ORGANISM="Detonula confervacea, Strain CCMP 353" /LENGTH=158 /DNA_ID=CAMNT_0013015929 /DNA_START=46 /DNA_END=522 /DNA_ORIENTATION=-